jgi:hypothetical protein
MHQNSTQQYTNTQTLAGGVWAMRSAWQKMFPYKIEGVRGDIVNGTGKISCCGSGLNGVPLPGGQIKMLANMAALPGGGGMPLRWQIN